MPSLTTQRRRATAFLVALTAVTALLAGVPAAAQVGQVVEIAQVGQAQLAQITPAAVPAEGYDWSVFIAAGFGLLGLYWIRRHISRL
ncbi:MAG: hypothetical protein AAGG11_05075 [Pseudomonadota bacterium]